MHILSWSHLPLWTAALSALIRIAQTTGWKRAEIQQRIQRDQHVGASRDNEFDSKKRNDTGSENIAAHVEVRVTRLGTRIFPKMTMSS